MRLATPAVEQRKESPQRGADCSPTSSFRRYASYVSGRDAYGASDAAAVFAPSISLAFWLLLSFARDALVHLNAIVCSVAAVRERPDPPSVLDGPDLSPAPLREGRC
jgi:hypothetical protein